MFDIFKRLRKQVTQEYGRSHAIVRDNSIPSRRGPRVTVSAHAPALDRCELLCDAVPSLEIAGLIEGIVGDEIRGWVLDQANPNRYLKLVLQIGGEFIEKTVPCIFRKDLEQKFHSKGLHGFSFRIPGRWLSELELTIQIRLENGWCLCPPSVLRNLTPHRSEPAVAHNPCLCVMHIPKTALTAVRNALRSDWLTDRQLWFYGDPPGFPAEHVLYLTHGQLQRAECVVGHFSYGFHRFLPQPVQYATVLRDPIKRCVSHYIHVRTKSPDPNAPARHMDLDELLRVSPDFNYDNLMVRMFTGKTNLRLGDITGDVLCEAIDVMHQEFCYVGLQKRTSEAVASLAAYLNLQPNPLQQENVGHYDAANAVTPAAIKRLCELNEFDLKLLDHAEKLLWTSGAQGWIRNVPARPYNQKGVVGPNDKDTCCQYPC